MTPFLDALHADGPAADRAGRMGLYAWAIGSWDLDVREYEPDGRLWRRRPGGWLFGGVLGGRAIQDVWIVPPRGARLPGADAVAEAPYCGTTLRVWDPGLEAWRIRWTDPVKQIHLDMIGRAEGAGIVQLGTGMAGQPIRWSFSDIGPDSFLWRGEASPDGGETWVRQVEFDARRRPSAAPGS